MADDSTRDDPESESIPPRLAPDVHPVDETAEPVTQPVQITAPEHWSAFTPPPIQEPLGDGPLPDIGPLSVPRRTPGPSFKRPAPAARSNPAPSPSRPTTLRPKRTPLWRRILVWIVKLILAFLLLSVAMVVVYRFIGPPVTWTMIGDIVGGHGATKRWMPLSRIDPSMA
ncbi:MAG: hypothetical protein EOP60_17190, partial [Sphingomonadales bacterium]